MYLWVINLMVKQNFDGLSMIDIQNISAKNNLCSTGQCQIRRGFVKEIARVVVTRVARVAHLIPFGAKQIV